MHKQKLKQLFIPVVYNNVKHYFFLCQRGGYVITCLSINKSYKIDLN